MHVQLQLKPYRPRHFSDTPLLMVCDGSPCHSVPEVKEAFTDAGWLVELFPPNMTAELQPMDLVVNAVVKST